jgi:hypothetical protein
MMFGAGKIIRAWSFFLLLFDRLCRVGKRAARYSNLGTFLSARLPTTP